MNRLTLLFTLALLSVFATPAFANETYQACSSYVRSDATFPSLVTYRAFIDGVQIKRTKQSLSATQTTVYESVDFVSYDAAEADMQRKFRLLEKAGVCRKRTKPNLNLACFIRTKYSHPGFAEPDYTGEILATTLVDGILTDTVIFTTPSYFETRDEANLYAMDMLENLVSAKVCSKDSLN